MKRWSTATFLGALLSLAVACGSSSNGEDASPPATGESSSDGSEADTPASNGSSESGSNAAGSGSFGSSIRIDGRSFVTYLDWDDGAVLASYRGELLDYWVVDGRLITPLPAARGLSPVVAVGVSPDDQGQTIWRWDPPDGYVVRELAHTGTVMAVLAIDGNDADRGLITVLDPEDGDVRWSQAVQSRNTYDLQARSTRDRIAFRNHDTAVLLAATSGVVVWTGPADAMNLDDEYFSVETDGALVVFDAESAEEIVRLEGSSFAQIATSGESAAHYFVRWQSATRYPTTLVVAVRNGRVETSNEVRLAGTPIRIEGELPDASVVLASTESFVALHPETLQEAWTRTKRLDAAYFIPTEDQIFAPLSGPASPTRIQVGDEVVGMLDRTTYQSSEPSAAFIALGSTPHEWAVQDAASGDLVVVLDYVTDTTSGGEFVSAGSTEIARWSGDGPRWTIEIEGSPAPVGTGLTGNVLPSTDLVSVGEEIVAVDGLSGREYWRSDPLLDTRSAAESGENVDALIASWREANSACRGGTPDTEETERACQESARSVEQLGDLGLCFYAATGVSADARWQECPEE